MAARTGEDGLEGTGLVHKPFWGSSQEAVGPGLSLPDSL